MPDMNDGRKESRNIDVTEKIKMKRHKQWLFKQEVYFKTIINL